MKTTQVTDMQQFTLCQCDRAVNKQKSADVFMMRKKKSIYVPHTIIVVILILPMQSRSIDYIVTKDCDRLL